MRLAPSASTEGSLWQPEPPQPACTCFVRCASYALWQVVQVRASSWCDWWQLAHFDSGARVTGVVWHSVQATAECVACAKGSRRVAGAANVDVMMLTVCGRDGSPFA